MKDKTVGKIICLVRCEEDYEACMFTNNCVPNKKAKQSIWQLIEKELDKQKTNRNNDVAYLTDITVEDCKDALRKLILGGDK